jgi:membrane protein
MRRAHRLTGRGLLWFGRAAREAVRDRIHRDGAQLAFFALLSFVPLAMLLVALLSLFGDETEVRRRLVTTIFDAVPLASESDRADIERSVLDALRRVGSLSVLSVVLLVVSASGVMGALRHTINVAYDIEERPSLVRRKALDALLVVVGTAVLGASLSLRSLGDFGAVVGFLLVAGVLASAYRFLPTHRPRWRDVGGGAVLAAFGLVLVREVLELYFEDLGNIGALYGSFGALLALLLFTYASAMVVLFGAELASELPRLPDDQTV